MSIYDILDKVLAEDLTYSQVLKMLKPLNLNSSELNKAKNFFYKLLGDSEKKKVVNNLPSYMYEGILKETISYVRDELYSAEIIQLLFEKYRLSVPLMTYFINEAISIVKLNTLMPEEISMIGEAYHKAASELESQGSKEKPVFSNSPQINAHSFLDIDLELN